MPRNISFMHTQEQFRRQTKTITRRLGWRFLKPGDILNGCEKCQGLKRGEKIRVLGQIRVISVSEERLNCIGQGDCARAIARLKDFQTCRRGIRRLLLQGHEMRTEDFCRAN